MKAETGPAAAEGKTIMNGTTVSMSTLDGIMARYRQIAPGADAGTPDPAAALIRWLTFAAQRAFTRMTGSHVSVDRGEVNLLIARFEALRLLTAVANADPEGADRLVRDILADEEDGGAIGEWLYAHGQASGIDTGEIARLADAEARIEAEAAPEGNLRS